MSHSLRWGGFVLLLASLAGCRGCTSSRPPFHLVPNMDDQPRYEAQAASAFFADGATMRPPVPGTVARGALGEDTVFEEGLDETGQPVAAMPRAALPFASEEATLVRGRERYDIYCVPCHGENGGGRGAFFEQGGVESADLHEERIRGLSDGELYGVITNGLGLMSGYRYPIPPEDRWAIVARVRELQSEGP
ncbi:MAG: cytochrome c [Acidobacteriota bacterium]